jgi:hypothetical protein
MTEPRTTIGVVRIIGPRKEAFVHELGYYCVVKIGKNLLLWTTFWVRINASLLKLQLKFSELKVSEGAGHCNRVVQGMNCHPWLGRCDSGFESRLGLGCLVFVLYVRSSVFVYR